MRKGRASFTAVAVAALRAAASDGTHSARDPNDQIALRMLSAVPATLARAIASGGATVRYGARAGSLGLLDHVALRSRKLDQLLRDAVSAGIDQVVVLGAGLDSRAHRDLGLERCVVYEVDHPDSQAMKLQRVVGLPVTCARVCHVPVVFGVEPLAGALQAAGFEASRPSFWIWEGVTMYLSASATRATLSEVASLCSQGSMLALSYMSPTLAWLRYAGPLVRGAMRVIGEPLLGVTSLAALHAELAAVDLAPCEDTDTRDWARQFGANAAPLIAYERIALASRSPR